MKINGISNPRWVRADHSLFDVDLEMENGEVWPFTACPDDPEPHGVEIWNKGLSGEFGEIAEFIPTQA